MPYATPRRPLHAAEPASFNGRPVRQAAPYSPMQDPCSWRGYNTTICATTSFPQRMFSIFGSTDASDPNWTPNGLGGNKGDGGYYISQNCAQFACENNYTDITNAQYWPALDARCCVAKPPQAWTMQPQIFTHGNFVKGERLRDKNGTSVYPTPNEAARILWDRGNYDYNPKNYHDCPYNPDGFGQQAIPGAKVYDVDPITCERGFYDTQVAKSIQSSLGLLNTPTPSVSSSPAKSTMTQSSAPVVTPSESTLSIGSTVVATTASAGILSTLAAFVAPTPTAVIAASAPATTVTGLAIGLGVLGSGVVIGGAVLAGYKLAQYCRTETPATTNTENIYEELEMNKKEVTDEPAWANLSECPFERPFAD